MDYFLNKVSQQAVSFAIRSGIIVTSQFAIRQCGRYISSVKGRDRKELQRLQERLETKIRIVSPAIDLVEIISARGNTSLESALNLTKEIRHGIEKLGRRMEALSNRMDKRKANPEEVKSVMEDIKALLSKIEDAVPFISLAVTTSGVTISTGIPQNVSPSRLLQASGMLSAGDTAYCYNPFNPAQIGQTFTLTLYMLFAGHSHRQEQVSAKDLTWQEVMHKVRVNLQRVPLFYDEDEGEAAGDKHIRAQSKIQEYCYELTLVEDLDDGRIHDTIPQPFEDVAMAGLRTRIPVHQISKMFYTTSGKLLGIEESNSPILLIKRNLLAPAPRKILEKVRGYTFNDDSDEDDSSYDDDPEPEPEPVHADLPRHLDPEWLAFEVFNDNFESPASSATVSAASSRPSSPAPGAHGPPIELQNALQNLSLFPNQPTMPKVRSDLSILECLLRLTILQNFQQAQHTTVHDELLNLFLSDALWGGSKEERRLEREQTRERIGFDPFATPVKGIEDAIEKLEGGGKKRVEDKKRIEEQSWNEKSSRAIEPSSAPKPPADPARTWIERRRTAEATKSPTKELAERTTRISLTSAASSASPSPQPEERSWTPRSSRTTESFKSPAHSDLCVPVRTPTPTVSELSSSPRPVESVGSPTKASIDATIQRPMGSEQTTSLRSQSTDLNSSSRWSQRRMRTLEAENAAAAAAAAVSPRAAKVRSPTGDTESRRSIDSTGSVSSERIRIPRSPASDSSASNRVRSPDIQSPTSSGRLRERRWKNDGEGDKATPSPQSPQSPQSSQSPQSPERGTPDRQLWAEWGMSPLNGR